MGAERGSPKFRRWSEYSDKGEGMDSCEVKSELRICSGIDDVRAGDSYLVSLLGIYVNAG